LGPTPSVRAVYPSRLTGPEATAATAATSGRAWGRAEGRIRSAVWGDGLRSPRHADGLGRSRRAGKLGRFGL